MTSFKNNKMNDTLPSSRPDENEEPEHEIPQAGCGILGRYPILSVLFFAITGLALGIGLSYWEPEDSTDKETAVKWIGLVGDMFIRALKAVVLPLVFVNVVLSMVEMMSLGRASVIGGKTIGLYLLTTFVASIIGILAIVCFKPLFKTEEIATDLLSRVQLGCSAEAGSYLTHDESGNVYCSAGNLTEGMNTYFNIEDIDNTFVHTSTGPEELSFSDTMYDGVFGKMITDNIFVAFVDSNFAAVVVFAICMGAALSRSLVKTGKKCESSVLVNFLKEVDDVLITLIHWIITVTPFAVFSLIASAIGGQSDLATAFSNVAYLVLAVMAGMIVHVFGFYAGLLGYITRSNPFEFFRFLIPAQTTAFACASSAATLPVSLKCAEDSGRIPRSIARFVLPLGGTINMDGSAIYFPCACVWLAVLNGLEPTFGNYILLAFLSTIGSAGTAPVPAAGLVMVLTAYNSVFGTTGTPDGFEFVVAIDWFLDRVCTVVNVTGDNVVACSIAHQIKMEGSEEFPEEDEEPIVAKTAIKDNGSVTLDAGGALDSEDSEEDSISAPFKANLYDITV